ncbi:MAG: hypothetical protein J6J12_07145 [Oscillospiraceae bacterium]|nr:hypothetical protein [Oscillospiraceae bacterium]
MKRYTTAIERRLNLPREIKNRVMSDFVSSICARREAGMTDEEIYTELGSPQKAAAELNEQMKEFAYRKNPWRYLFAVGAVYGGVKLLSGLWVNLIWLGVQIWDYFSTDSMAVSIGVIGGADGPTAIFVTSPPWAHYLVPFVLVIVGIWGFYRLSRCKQKE